MSERAVLVGITTDVAEPTAPGRGERSVVSLAYAQAVRAAGGVPVLLPAIPELAAEHARACDAIVMTGGDDPKMEHWGIATHPAATTMHPQRQAYELALLAALDAVPQRPVLGICLGMQLMALHHGGRLNQHLPDTLLTHEQHKNATHRVEPVRLKSGMPVQPIIPDGDVASNHHQAVESAGAMRVLAKSADGVIEAVMHPGRGFYIGVQWHPERTADPRLGRGLFEWLVSAAGGASPEQMNP